MPARGLAFCSRSFTRRSHRHGLSVNLDTPPLASGPEVSKAAQRSLRVARNSARFKAVALRATAPHPTSLREATFSRRGRRESNENRNMTELPFDADAIIDAMAPLLGLGVGEASRGPVKTHLEIAARYAALLEEADLDDHEEPAPVFTP
jgi:hypothetical protein